MHNNRRGTATTETVLVIPVLLIMVSLAPWVAHLFLDLMVARTEAHRDAFDKTTTFLLLPESFMDNHINDAAATQFGEVNATTRQHAFATFPEEVPSDITDLIGGPESTSLTIKGIEFDTFPEGFPNNAVEGWEYIRHQPKFGGSQPIHMMTYAAVARSPWTYLGWPWIPTQDAVWEPKLLQDWHGEQDKIGGMGDNDDEDGREKYKLAE
jgi:hypothetical protein